MGNHKVKWTPDEENALKAGVVKYGVGRWKNILKDPEFAPHLTNRSNIDLKDKWRNMSISYGQSSRDKTRAHRVRTVASEALFTRITENIPVLVGEADAVGDDYRSPVDMKNAPGYNATIFEALSSIKDPNGSSIDAIAEFIEQKYEVPHNFKRLLSTKLRRLVLQGKLKKVGNCYRMKDAALGMKTPMTVENSGLAMPEDTVEAAAMTAADKIAEAENISLELEEAVKEAERVSAMAEDADSLVLLAEEIFKKCSRVGTILLA